MALAPQNARGEDNAAVQRFNAANVEVQLRVAPTHTSTAGKIVADLEVTAPASVMVEISASESQSRHALNVVGETSSGPVTVRPGWMRYRRRVEYRPFLGGTYVVPAFAISYRSPAGSAQILTSPAPVVVKSVINGDPAGAEPADLIPITAAKAVRWWAVIGWTSALAFGLAFAGWFYFRRRARRLPLPPPGQLPIERAITTIASLPATDVRGLEHAIESLRAKGHDPLPGLLAETYQWIRFGAPTPRDVEEFRTILMRYLRHEARLDPTEEHG